MRGHEATRDHSVGRVSTLIESQERGFYRTTWLCEKWSEEAVEFTRKALEREGVSHVMDGYHIGPSGVRDKIASAVAGRDVTRAILVPRLIPITHGITSEQLRKYVGDPEVVEEVEGNLLLNEGIARMIALLIGAGGAAYNNAGSYVGVGDSAAAEAQTQTELSAATNRFYKISVGGYPLTPGSGSPAANSADFRSDFTTTEANYAWNGWTVAAGASTASGSGFTTGTTNLNRKVQSLGTKATGTWTMTGTITF